jgi:hypothetical protein
MAKTKIYDIVPPGKRSKYLKEAKLEDKKAVAKRQPSRDVASKRFSKRNVFLAVAVIVLGLIIYWSFSVAHSVVVEIWPSVFPVNFTATVSFSTGQADFDLAEAELSSPVLPAEFLEAEKTFKKEFPASVSELEEKATGVIRVSSKASRNITLVEGTRFLSSSEPTRQFHTLKRITVPAGGNIDVPVIASEPGEEYNIEPCSFSIPGLRNSSPPQLYYDIFGKSSKKMTGGSSDAIKKIRQEDVDSASRQILKIAEQEAVALMEGQAGDGYRILDKSVKVEVLNEGLLDAAIGQQAENFNYEITIKASTLVVKSEYLEKLAQKYLLASVPANKSFQEDNFKIEFLPSTFATETDEQGQVTISADISISSSIYSQIDVQSLEEIAKNRDKKNISRYVIEIYPEIRKRPRVLFSPFWARKSGNNSENIEIKLNFD